jgi:3-isopropylmalate dehydrogenase
MSSKSYTVAVLAGDGIGPECTESAVRVVSATAESSGVKIEFLHREAGAALYAEKGYAMDRATMEVVGSTDATLLGAMGMPDIRRPDGLEIAPQIDLREHYGLYASLRPVRRHPGIAPTVTAQDIDMLVIRETTEGLFAGRHDPVEHSDSEATDRLTITRAGCLRLFHQAFRHARRRKLEGTQGKVTLFDKANVLKSFVFMRKVFDEVASEYPDIETERLYIDAGCMIMVLDPGRFDVIVTENQFGDIVSELAAGLVGGLGVCPSADLSDDHGVFQPCHGSAPDIAGKGVANPIATVLSAAMMLDWLSAKHDDRACAGAAARIRASVDAVLEHGPHTPDLGGEASTVDITEALMQNCT